MLCKAFVCVSLLMGATMAMEAQNVVTSTAKDTRGVSLTIYNQNFAVVRENRQITLKEGVNLVRYEDVAAQIDPTSISFKSLTAPNAVAVREQNYQYDLLNPTSILNKSVGKTIRFKQVHPDGKVEILEGTLLNPPTAVVGQTDAGGGGTVYQGLVIRLKDGRLILNPTGQIELNELPEGLVSRPSLLWKLDVDRAGTHHTQVSYLANGITWKADYVAVVNKDESMVDITGWVTIDNRSGATYTDAQLQLLAGDVRRVQEAPGMGGVPMDAMMVKRAAAPQFEEEAFFEYHLYTLQGTTTVRDNETKQMTLLSAADVKVTRKLVLDAGRRWWIQGIRAPGMGGDTQNVKLNIVVEMRNSKENNMGMPLPKGKVRLYKADDRGNLQFLGEDLIDHTPKDELVRLYIGDAFDVVGERKRTDYKQISDRVIEETYEITVRNHKETDVDVWIVEHFWGEWQILNSSHQYNKLDAHTVEFPVKVERNGAVKVTYTARTKW
ncbi:MAG: DUF4139 domain-containing protein [Armatimonadota bacterium]|nr:MAG: DUF4139 domain-containing protein [Armatimonadota bacterium]